MASDSLRTKLRRMLAIELPVIASSHCRDVAVPVVDSGSFGVQGEAMHSLGEIAADPSVWRRSKGARKIRGRHVRV